MLNQEEQRTFDYLFYCIHCILPCLVLENWCKSCCGCMCNGCTTPPHALNSKRIYIEDERS